MLAKGLAPTRSRARDLIKRGVVLVGGKVETRAGLGLPPGAEIARGGGLERLCLARRAEAGGGARRIRLRSARAGGARYRRLDRRLHADAAAARRAAASMRSMSAAASFTPTLPATRASSTWKTPMRGGWIAPLVPEPPGAITADVSFISLAKAMPAALALAAPGAWLVALVKPQFEVGREGVGKGGIVRSEALRRQALDEVAGVFRARSRAGAWRAPSRRRSRASPAMSNFCWARAMRLELTIDRLGAQGDGIADTPDGPVYVPFTLPGERVTADVEKGRGAVARTPDPLAGTRRADLPPFRRLRRLRAAASGTGRLSGVEAPARRGSPAPGGHRRGGRAGARLRTAYAGGARHSQR